jgi:hypothetical protein
MNRIAVAALIAVGACRADQPRGRSDPGPEPPATHLAVLAPADYPVTSRGCFLLPPIGGSFLVEIGDTGQPDSAFIRATLTPRDEAPTALIGRPPYEAPYFLQFGRTPLPPGLSIHFCSGQWGIP